MHDRRPPDIAALLSILDGRGVRYVLVGSAAALAYGVPLVPRDLDIVPGDADDVRSFDTLLSSKLGDFDVVPQIAGSYESLRSRAQCVTAFGRRVLVAHVADLLSCLTIPRREEDRARVAALREIQKGR